MRSRVKRGVGEGADRVPQGRYGNRPSIHRWAILNFRQIPA